MTHILNGEHTDARHLPSDTGAGILNPPKYASGTALPMPRCANLTTSEAGQSLTAH